MSWIKDNGGPVALVVILLAAIAGYIELRLPSEADIKVKVDGALDEMTSDFPDITEDRVVAIESDISEIKDTLVRQDQKTDRIIDILLEE